MPRKIQTTSTLARSKTIAVMGDSLSFSAQFGVSTHLYWPKVLQDRLNAAGARTRVRDFGKSGTRTNNETTQPAGMQTRFPNMFEWGTPDLGIIFGGVNDPGAGLTQAQTQRNIESMCQALKHNAPYFVADETLLPAGEIPGRRYVVLTDGSATGGVAEWPGQAARIGGAGGGAVTVWENRNGLAGVAGWGRVAVAATPASACSRVAVVSAHYLNWATGGDTLATPYAAYVPVRAAQSAAATAQGAAFCNLYDFMRQRIVDGSDTQGTPTQFVAEGNQHFNAYGHALVAEVVRQTIAAQSGWITALS